MFCICNERNKLVSICPIYDGKEKDKITNKCKITLYISFSLKVLVKTTVGKGSVVRKKTWPVVA